MAGQHHAIAQCMSDAIPSEKAGSAPLSAESLAAIAQKLVDAALKAGADQAEAGIVESRSLEVGIRNGALEDVERSESRDVGLRVLIGKRQAGVAFSDLSTDGQAKVVERAIAMAKVAPEDPYCGLVDPDQLVKSPVDIPLYEDHDWDPQKLEETGLALESAAMAVKGVDQVVQAGASYSAGASAFVTSTGFVGSRKSSSNSLGIAALAKRNGQMERDFDSHSARRLSDLKSAGEIGQNAGERAVARLGGEKLDSGKMPVVFDRRVAATFISSMLGAISGSAITRGTSFLRDKLGEQIFAEGIDIIEDPLKPWSFGARAWDGEGVPVKARALIEDGVLTTWLLNASTARQLDLPLTGHAGRNLGGPPGVRTSNVHLSPGDLDQDGLLKEAGNGLLVTEMFGPSLNDNTGDWSVGVAGFAITDGNRAGPVSEVTVAGNLLNIYANMVPGSDLEFRGSTNSPSLLVDGLSVGGR